MAFARSSTYWVLLALTSLWVALIIAAPFERSLNSALAPWLYFCFTPICHQLPERSLEIFGYPLAVCARCTGIYFGFWISLASLSWMTPLNRKLVQQPRLILLFMLPMAIDVVSPNTHTTRLVSGLLAGFPVPLFVWIAMEQVRGREVSRRSS